MGNATDASATTSSPADEPPPDPATLKSAINSSAEKCRNTLIAMLGAMLYLLVAVGSTTDKDLLMPVSQLELPVVGAKVGLVPFYVMAPVLLVLFHLTLLFYLLEHRRNVARLSQYDGRLPHYSFHAFLFNSLMRKTPGTIDYFFVSTLNNIAIVVAPFLLLILIQVRFSDFQSVSYTLWHFLFVLLDVLLLALYWERMENDDWLKEEFNNPGRLLLAALRRGSIIGWFNLPMLLAWLVFWAACIGALAGGQLNAWYELRPGALTLQWLFLLTGVLLALIVLLRPASWMSLGSSALLTIAWLWFIYATTNALSFAGSENNARMLDSSKLHYLSSYPTWILGLCLIVVWVLFRRERKGYRQAEAAARPLAWITLNGVTLSALLLMVLLNVAAPDRFEKTDAGNIAPVSQQQVLAALLSNQVPQGIYCLSMEWVCPRLKLKGEFVSSAKENQISDAIAGSSLQQQARDRQDKMNSALLAGRYLRMADFSESMLYRINMESVHAEGSLWNGASMHDVDARHSNFTGAQFQYATTTSMEFYSADLDGADLSGADLPNAKFYGANLLGARLHKSKLAGTDLSKANLTGADLSEATLAGASLTSAQLAGANLSSAVLAGVDLSEAMLVGADLSSAMLVQVLLYRAKLIGADLTGAVLNGSFIGEAQLVAEKSGAFSGDMALPYFGQPKTSVDEVVEPDWEALQISAGEQSSAEFKKRIADAEERWDQIVARVAQDDAMKIGNTPLGKNFRQDSGREKPAALAVSNEAAPVSP